MLLFGVIESKLAQPRNFFGEPLIRVLLLTVDTMTES